MSRNLNFLFILATVVAVSLQQLDDPLFKESLSRQLRKKIRSRETMQLMLSYVHGTVIQNFGDYACTCLIKKPGVKMTVDNHCVQTTQAIFDDPQKIDKMATRITTIIQKQGIMEKVFQEENGNFEDADTMAQKTVQGVNQETFNSIVASVVKIEISGENLVILMKAIVEDINKLVVEDNTSLSSSTTGTDSMSNLIDAVKAF